ncbi:MAG: DNA-processing protein DprA [Blautia faecis]
MAKGVDSYAHTACLKAKGYTVAVLANGLDICYPSEHEKLKECIENKGLVISEYPPGIRPTKYTFPKRNRLISAWSDELIVVAAGKKSGALITADYSKNMEGKLFIVSKLANYIVQ